MLRRLGQHVILQHDLLIVAMLCTPQTALLADQPPVRCRVALEDRAGRGSLEIASAELGRKVVCRGFRFGWVCQRALVRGTASDRGSALIKRAGLIGGHPRLWCELTAAGLPLATISEEFGVVGSGSKSSGVSAGGVSEVCGNRVTSGTAAVILVAAGDQFSDEVRKKAVTPTAVSRNAAPNAGMIQRDMIRPKPRTSIRRAIQALVARIP